MRGKYSIKIVLPLLVPDMEKAYNKLDLVHNGSDAMRVFAVLENMQDKEEALKYRKALLNYCEIDTRAMVEILKVLRLSISFNNDI